MKHHYKDYNYKLWAGNKDMIRYKIKKKWFIFNPSVHEFDESVLRAPDESDEAFIIRVHSKIQEKIDEYVIADNLNKLAEEEKLEFVNRVMK